ncbi:MAG: diguanylate cyclase [Candidatus Binatia bacterium]
MQAPGSILVVDDRESNRHLMREILESAGHRVTCASNGTEGIELAIAAKPDLILLDVKMPGMDGFEVSAKLRSLAETAIVPIMFVTAHYTEEQDVLHGLGVGAYDYLIKPISRAVLLARVGVVLRIRRSEDRLRQLSSIDELTGLHSRSYVVRRLEAELQRAPQHDTRLTATMLDVDDLRSCNDTFGHEVGDEVLRRVSGVLKSNTRLCDSVGRYAGDQFLIVQPEVDEREALAWVERLNEKVAEEGFHDQARELQVSFSAGIAAWERRASAEALIHFAESALDVAKRAGKRQTVCYSQMGAASAAADASN